ncbi:hypothetical protein CEXT_625351 [Caerostris extrusa]|uniref:Ycf15 n=1 Tax=Caerostris extrusa TaxID=172846 RepID=A0AAV4S3R9_CAEEX|nr:hypothetical protein CEXT_625351 [Caerostris extrusa]
MLRSPNERLLRFNLTTDSRLQPDIWKLSEIPWVNEDFFVLALLFERAKKSDAATAGTPVIWYRENPLKREKNNLRWRNFVACSESPKTRGHTS